MLCEFDRKAREGSEMRRGRGRRGRRIGRKRERSHPAGSGWIYGGIEESCQLLNTLSYYTPQLFTLSKASCSSSEMKEWERTNNNEDSLDVALCTRA